MQHLLRIVLGVVSMYALAVGPPAYATDVDGPDDCQRAISDFGDAPEEVLAYPGVPGRFPTCLRPGPIGTQELACLPISTPPGQAGFVWHTNSLINRNYWLGCLPTAPLGIDPELDGKMNDTGAGGSACDQSIQVDCVEPAFGMQFGQDECYGTDDAGLAAPVVFSTCTQATVSFLTFSCAAAEQEVYLNILVDWNEDGDWNDNFHCPGGVCSYEWAVKNVPIVVLPGCNTMVSPSFLTGPNPGHGWMRITISDEPVHDDFPWAGSATVPSARLFGGETEDYPVEIEPEDTCESYRDFGDAPEEIQAYAGVSGHFPTCTFPSTPGTQEIACLPALSTPPGQTGYVEHVRNPGDPLAFWLGCAPPGVDGESDGKTNDTGGPFSACPAFSLAVDCVEPWWLNFGQDECYGDGVDAGIQNPITFTSCTPSSVTFDAFNCGGNTVQVYLNILVDWNHDGDWNDNFQCPGGVCSYEWAVKNAPITLAPGCQTLTSPTFLSGPPLAALETGEGWLRITLSERPATDDFPWDGTATRPDGPFKAGETEDYPVKIARGPCDIGYEDFGDAPEDIAAYPSGTLGRFPTCLYPSTPGTQEIQCGLPRSSVPGPTGYVRHVASPDDPWHFWLGCGPVFPSGVDSEHDGKVEVSPGAPPVSHCDPTVVADCVESAFGMNFAQDECFGDGVDAGVMGPLTLPLCSTAQIHFRATNCGPVEIEVYLNILVDWNYDGDWNDNIQCAAGAACAFEWAIKNVPIVLTPGCNPYVSPTFNTGPNGLSWMRVTLTAEPVSDDFPWNGSVSAFSDVFRGGETEDYSVTIPPLDTGDPEPPSTIGLAPPWPNPGRTFTSIHFGLPRAAHVDLIVYDVSGRKVRTLVSGVQSAGRHAVRWDYRTDDGRLSPAGLYLVTLITEGKVFTRRTIRIE